MTESKQIIDMRDISTQMKINQFEDSKSDLLDTPTETESIEDYVECPCLHKHPGKDMLNIVISNLNVKQLFESLFTQSKFIAENWRVRKLYDAKVNEWDDPKSVRHLEYSIDMGTFGKPRNFEQQVTINLQF